MHPVAGLIPDGRRVHRVQGGGVGAVEFDQRPGEAGLSGWPSSGLGLPTQDNTVPTLATGAISVSGS